METFKIKEVLEISCTDIERFSTERKWINDSDSPDGGCFVNVKKELEVPRLKMNFKATVDKELLQSAFYTDGTNTFIALSKNEIMLAELSVESFRVPKELVVFKSSHPEC